MSKDNGGPAFPTVEANYHNENMRSEGLSIRDYFAAKASDADVASVMAEYMVNEDFGSIVISHCSITRQQARYMHADSMLLERAK